MLLPGGNATRPASRFAWERELRRDRNLSRSAYMLGFLLATYADGDGSRVHPGEAILAADTRQTQRAVRKQLGELRAAGWITRTVRSNRQSGRADVYRLSAPAEHPPPASAESDVEAPTESDVEAPDYRNTHSGSERQTVDDYRNTHSGLPEHTFRPPSQGPSQLHTPSVCGARQPADDADTSPLIDIPEADEAEQQRDRNRTAQTITRTYVQRVPLSKFPAVQNIVRRALDAGYTSDRVETALLALAEQGWPVTVDALRIELDGPPRSRARPDRDQEITEFLNRPSQARTGTDGGPAPALYALPGGDDR